MQKLLIVKLGAIGDIVMASTIIPYIKKNQPDTEIHWLGGSSMRPLLQSLCGIDRLLFVDDKKLLTGSVPEKADTILSVWKQIAFKHYDTILLPYRDKRYALLTLLSRHKSIRSFAGGGREQIIPGRYHGAEYMRLAGAPDDISFSEISYPALQFPTDYSYNLPISNNERNLIILSPGGARNLLQENDIRRYPIHSYVALAKELLAAKYRVVITGTKDDNWVSSYFNGLPIDNVIGKTTFLDILSLIQQSTCFIGHDSGLLHLTKLTGTPAIGLFGPVAPAERIGVGSNIRPLWAGETLSCSPCYDGRNFANCSDNQCLSGIRVDQIMLTLQNLLGNERV